MRRTPALATLILCLLLSASAQAETVSYTPFTLPVGGFQAWDLSPDGSIAGVFASGSIHRWTAAGGFVHVGDVAPGSPTFAMSDDGNVFVGSDLDVPDSTGVVVPVRYVEGQGWEVLGAPQDACNIDGQMATAWDLSGDGETMVGMTWLCGAKVEAFSWTEAGGYVALGSSGVEGGSRATKISGDGSTIVGWSYAEGTTSRSPVRWVDGGPLDHFMGTGFKGEAMAVSSDGSKICGKIQKKSFYYNGAGNAIEFAYPSIDPNDYTYPAAIADDGTVVGWYGNAFYQTMAACIWRPGEGVSDLKQWANARGAGLPDNMSLTVGLAISADGSTIAVQTYTPTDSTGAYTDAILLHLTGTRTDAAVTPSREKLRLHAPYPNPFNPSTTIAFELERAETVQLDILDVAGRKVRTLTRRNFDAGRHELRWDGRDDMGRSVASGSYFARVATENSSRTRKLTLVK